MNINISKNESDEIFRNILWDYVQSKSLLASTNPQGVILGGQPGSGKSFLKNQIIQEFKDEIIFVSTDDLRLYHPAYLELQKNAETVQNAANLVNSFASDWTEKLIDYCTKNKCNLIIDSTMGGNIKSVYETINKFRSNGFEVHLRVMAVPAITSKLSVFLRYETQLAEKGFARWTRMEDHDDRFGKLERNIANILNDKLTNSIAYFTRVFDKQGTTHIVEVSEPKFLEIRKYKYSKSRFLGLGKESFFFYHPQIIETIRSMIINRGGDTTEFDDIVKGYFKGELKS